MKIIITILFTLFFFTSIQAQNTFEKAIDTLGSVGANCVQETFDGGYVICGSSSYGGNDANIVKLDSSGTIEWVKVYGGPSYEYGLNIIQLPDSGYIVDGVYDGGSLNVKNWLLRLDSKGDTLWTKVFSAGSGGTSAYQMAVNKNGNFGLTGYYDSFAGIPLAAYFIGTDSSGSFISGKRYTTTYGTEGHAITNCLNNDFSITGAIRVNSTDADLYIIHTNSLGDTLWTKHYNNSYLNVGYAIEQTVDSGYIVAGTTWNFTESCYNVYLVKTNSIGDTLWTKMYYNFKEATANSVQQTSDGGYIVTGLINSAGPTNNGNLYLFKTNSYGDTLWTREYGGNAPDYGNFVRQTKDGGYIISGFTSSYGGTYLIKTDSLGNVASSTGVAEINNPLKFSVYPNPSNGIFSIDLKGISKQNSNIEIYNLHSEQVYSCKAINNSTLHLNLSYLTNGMYLILLRTNNKIYSSKIIIQK